MFLLIAVLSTSCYVYLYNCIVLDSGVNKMYCKCIVFLLYIEEARACILMKSKRKCLSKSSIILTKYHDAYYYIFD